MGQIAGDPSRFGSGGLTVGGGGRFPYNRSALNIAALDRRLRALAERFLSLAGRRIGRTAAFWVLPLLNVALLVLVFLIAARAAGAVFGLVLAAVTFFNFHVFENSVIIMSDLPSMGLLLLAAFLVHRNGLSAKPIRSLLAGACFGPSRLLGFFRFLRPP